MALAWHVSPEVMLPWHSLVGKRLPTPAQGARVVVVVVDVCVSVRVVVVEEVVELVLVVVVVWVEDEAVLVEVVVVVDVVVVVLLLVVVVKVVVVKVVSPHCQHSTQVAQVHNVVQPPMFAARSTHPTRHVLGLRGFMVVDW